MKPHHSLLASFLLCAACTTDPEPEPASTSGSESTDTDDSDTDDAGTETGAVSSETDGGEPGGTSDDEGCEWTNFASQYGIAATQGPSCGSPSNPEPMELDAIVACLDEALAAGEAATAMIRFYGPGEDNLRRRWYVRPEGETPRLFEVRGRQPYVEEGDIPDESFTVFTCSSLSVEDCEGLPFSTSDSCTACAGRAPFPCE